MPLRFEFEFVNAVNDALEKVKMPYGLGSPDYIAIDRYKSKILIEKDGKLVESDWFILISKY